MISDPGKKKSYTAEELIRRLASLAQGSGVATACVITLDGDDFQIEVAPLTDDVLRRVEITDIDTSLMNT